MYGAVLVPPDGSKGVEPAVRHGLDVASRFDSTVHALHVVDLTDIQEELLSDVPPEWKQAGDHSTREIADEAADLGLESISEVDRGSPHERILDYVDDHGIDLVAMGTHGRSGLSKWLLGSVTERVLQTSDDPVLTVRPGEPRTVVVGAQWKPVGIPVYH